MLIARWFRCSSCAQTVIHFSTLIWNSASNSAGDYSRNVCSKCAHNKQERVLKFCWKYPPQLVENNTTGFTLNMLVIMLKCLLEMCWDSCWNKSKLVGDYAQNICWKCAHSKGILLLKLCWNNPMDGDYAQNVYWKSAHSNGILLLKLCWNIQPGLRTTKGNNLGATRVLNISQ